MGFRDYLRNIFSTKSSLASLLTYKPRRYNFVSYEDLVQNSYLSNPYVYAGIELIAKAIASIPLYVKDKSSGNEIIEDHPVIELLRRPNKYQTWSNFIHGIVGFYYLHGNVYIQKTNKQRPKELHLLKPDRVEINVSEENPDEIVSYTYTLGDEVYEIDPELILHIKAFNPLSGGEDDLYGRSPLASASKSIIMNNRAKDWNISLIENNARLSGALVTKEKLPEKVKQELRKMINEIYSSPENAGRPILLEGGLDWKEMSLRPVEMDWTNVLKISASEICLVLGIPESLLHESANSSYATYRIALKDFYYHTVIPLLKKILENLNVWLVVGYGSNFELTFDIDSIPALSEDAIEVWDRVIRARLAGILSKNEARRFLAQPDVEDDDFYTPVNVYTSDVEKSGSVSPYTLRRTSEKKKEGKKEEE